MTEKLKAYLDSLFEAVPNTREVREAKDELYDGMIERYEDCLRSGMDEQAAYDCVVDSIGDIRELIAELDTGEEDGPAAEQPKEPFDLNAFVKGVTDFASGFVSGVADGISDWFKEPVLGEMRLVNTLRQPMQGISNVDITYVSDSVRFLHTEGDELVIREYMNRDDASLLAEMRCENGSVDIRHGRRAGLFILRSRIEVLLPHSYSGGLRISTVSGRILSDEAWRLSSLTAKSISGDIELESITAGMVRASSTSGSVRIAFADGALDVHTVSGSIRAESVRGEGGFSSTSGGVRANFEELRGNVKASTVSGGIRLNVPEDASVELDLRSTTGAIHTAFNDSLSYHRRNRVHAFVGTEPYHNIQATSTSGGIHIND